MLEEIKMIIYLLAPMFQNYMTRIKHTIVNTIENLNLLLRRKMDPVWDIMAILTRWKQQKDTSFLCFWKDGSTNWIPLKDMYSSNPLETAKFAVACQLQDEPVFAWWVDNILKARNHIINKIKSRLLKYKQQHYL